MCGLPCSDPLLLADGWWSCGDRGPCACHAAVQHWEGLADPWLTAHRATPEMDSRAASPTGGTEADETCAQIDAFDFTTGVQPRLGLHVSAIGRFVLPPPLELGRRCGQRADEPFDLVEGELDRRVRGSAQVLEQRVVLRHDSQDVSDVSASSEGAYIVESGLVVGSWPSMAVWKNPPERTEAPPFAPAVWSAPAPAESPPFQDPADNGAQQVQRRDYGDESSHGGTLTTRSAHSGCIHRVAGGSGAERETRSRSAHQGES